MSQDLTSDLTISPDEGRGRAWHRSRRTRIVGGVTLVVIVVGVLGFFVPAQWAGRILPGSSIVDDGAVAFRPGAARVVIDEVSVTGTTTYEPEGHILFTTVSIDDSLSVWEWVEASVDDSIDLRTRESVFGDRSESENRERNLQLMQYSKDTAVVVALSRLGYDVLQPNGIAFEETVAASPAEGLLAPGDVIVGLDDEAVTDAGSLMEILDHHDPGDEVVLALEDLETGQARQVTLVLGVHPEGGGPFIGIGALRERIIDAPLPFDVEIDSGKIGGPSAGLAFTLTILDLLTPGELTGGNEVAVTGTIALDGSVGNVGGVAQKAAAAQARGAKLFIVPEASLDVARATAGSMQVVGVSSLDSALEALSDLGGQTSELALPVDGPQS